MYIEFLGLNNDLFELTNIVCVIHAKIQMRSKICSSLSSDYCPQIDDLFIGFIHFRLQNI